MKRYTLALPLLLWVAAPGCTPKDDKAPAAAQSSASAASTAKSAAPSAAAGEQKAQPEGVDAAVLALFKPLPDVMESPSNPLTEEKITLGRMLYFDKRLSKNHDFSCNSCHLLDKYGVDNEATSPGHKQARGDRNSPTVYNAAGHFVQFWDGRAPDVEEQAKGPVLNPVEMAMPDEAAVVTTLKSMPGYVKAFEAAFPGEAEPVTFDNFAKAVGAFERKLVTPAPWDRFLKGDSDAITAEQKKGANLFVSTGCTACHMGPYVGGAMFQKLGLVSAWPDLKDEGRKAETKNDSDLYMFKVPSLRNIAKTGPYLHDGSIADLKTMVQLMAKHQLGRELSDDDTQSIIAWFDSLTGELPTDYIKEPTLPESTDSTPKPDPT